MTLLSKLFKRGKHKLVWHFVDDSTDKNIAVIGLIKRNTPVSIGYKTIVTSPRSKLRVFVLGFQVTGLTLRGAILVRHDPNVVIRIDT